MSNKKVPLIWELVAEDLRNCGGPMGTDRPITIFRKYYRKQENAEQAAVEHYNENTKDKKAELDWYKYGDRRSTGAMGWLMYSIFPRKIED